MTGHHTEPFASRLLEWFDQHGRHDLPWQHPRTPYRVWLSEVMLQQTQVGVVVPYFQRFVAALPTLRALAEAPPDGVLALWSGLGYYARARNLQAAARICIDQHGGELPRDAAQLMELPGIGRSTAGAILSQAWGDRFPILDGNVRRVLARYHGVEGWPGQPAIQSRLWTLATGHLPDARMADYTQAQMDLGASVCTRGNPSCSTCPLQGHCIAYLENRTADLPTPRPIKPRPRRTTLLLVARDAHSRVLLQRRPPSGIWGGLWSLPEADDEVAARGWFDRHVSGDFDQRVAIPSITHGFTHFRLHLQPLRWDDVAPRALVADNDDLRWVDGSMLDSLGIPAPIRKLLQDT